jgi:hypothetical protein
MDGSIWLRRKVMMLRSPYQREKTFEVDYGGAQERGMSAQREKDRRAWSTKLMEVIEKW